MRILDFSDGFESSVAPTASPIPASSISVTPAGDLGSTNVQAALQELQGDIDALEGATVTASSVTNTPSGNLAATNVQTALNELQGDIDTINGDIGSLAAADVSNTPSGNLAATNAQTALNELQGDIDTINNKIGAVSGIASLDGSGKVPTSQLPSIVFVDVYAVADIAARDALTVQEGDIAIVADAGGGTSKTYIYDGASWLEMVADGSLAAHMSDTSAHGTSGDVVGTSDSQTLTNKTISGASNTISNINLASQVTGTLPIGNGGTGQTTANAALNALLPTQTANAGKVLQTDGTNTSWALSGGSALNVVSTSTTPYNATTANDLIVMDASGGNKTVNLFTAVGNSGKVLYIKKSDTSFNTVTIDGDGTETIEGSTTTTLNTEDEMLKIVSDGANWIILERVIPSYNNTYTVAITATSNPTKATTVDADLAVWARSGKNMILKYIYQHTNNAGATTGSGEYAFSLPSGLTVDTSLIGLISGGEVLGSAQVQYGATLYNCQVTYRGSTSNFGINGNNAGTGFLVGSASTPLNGSTIIYAMTAIIPISGWNA